MLAYSMLYFSVRLHSFLAFLIAGLLLTAAGSRAAYAETLGLDFSLPASSSPAEPAIAAADYNPLAIPAAAIAPPLQTQVAQLPPPPGSVPTTRVLLPLNEKAWNDRSQPPQSAVSSRPVSPRPSPHTMAQPAADWLFAGGADSLVARAVGSAEGTRTAEGGYTWAYYGHLDPGNGVWNLGSFSYQHGASSPAAADAQQLARLQRQSQQLADQAAQQGLELSTLEKLNGIDLANQSPKAALERGGYIERLAEAQQQGMAGTDAILWARIYAYLDPETHRWDAPGLGNTLQGIRHDQARRLRAISHSLTKYPKQNYDSGRSDRWHQ
ncbi:MAG: hypothetical protein F6J97_13810 [Leptolyngbya sp. SIO4C1]|nr:hypothetical protein [Leptolyngbya sp. SIO4C1]